MYMCLCVPRNHRVREAVREKENAGREGESVHESKNELCKKKKEKKIQRTLCNAVLHTDL